MVLKADKLHCMLNDDILLDDISLELHPGKLYGILGPNGSGKSTLLRHLGGIWQPTRGSVYWNDTPLHSLPRNQISRTISLVPQNSPVHFDFTVSDVVAMGRYPHARSSSRAENRQLIANALEQVDLWELRDRLVTHLSNGETQRVYIARALVTESPVLLLDEPTANLDVRHQLEIWQLLQDLVAQGKLIVVTVHDLNATLRFCEEIAVLEKGRCLAYGSPNEVLDDYILGRVFGVTQTPTADAKDSEYCLTD